MGESPSKNSLANDDGPMPDGANAGAAPGGPTLPAPAAGGVVSHELLFADVPPSVCDACGEPLVEDAAEGYGIPGQGVYLWARGEETRLESVPLCSSCASAIGMTALARWEIEEEEG
jgi:hypothetical protein